MATLPGFDESPLRYVRVGVLLLSRDRCVTAADATARALLDVEDGLEGRALTTLVEPMHAEDRTAASAPPMTTFLGRSATGTRLLVHITSIPGMPFDTCATVTSVNEYLAEAQALARVQLRQTVESIIAGFAHEVRNPLAAILSLTEAVMQQHQGTDSQLVRIPDLVSRVESLIRQALAYSKPKAPKRALHHPTFLVDKAVALLRPREQRAAPLTVVAADTLPPVYVDLLHAEQVLVNLIENARDVAVREVRVSIQQGETLAPSVRFSVVDDGPGVGHDVATRIFDPFFTTKAQGTGLGLSIARDLARLNGGDLSLAHAGERGATFWLDLPSTPAAIRGQW